MTTRERRRDPASLSGYNSCSPAIWDARRLTAVTRYEGRIERSLFASLRALEERAAEQQNEPEGGNIATQDATAAEQNEPEREPAQAALAPSPTVIPRLLAGD